MPLPKKKSTTSNSDPVVLEQPSPPLPEQQTFHEHLRTLTRNAVRVVIEEVMREELKEFLGEPGERVRPGGKDIAMGPTLAISRPPRVPSKHLKFPEIERDTSIPKSLIVTAATNPR